MPMVRRRPASALARASISPVTRASRSRRPWTSPTAYTTQPSGTQGGRRSRWGNFIDGEAQEVASREAAIWKCDRGGMRGVPPVQGRPPNKRNKRSLYQDRFGRSNGLPYEAQNKRDRTATRLASGAL